MSYLLNYLRIEMLKYVLEMLSVKLICHNDESLMNWQAICCEKNGFRVKGRRYSGCGEYRTELQDTHCEYFART